MKVKSSKNKAFALVMTLNVLVILSGLILSFLLKSTNDSKIADFYTKRILAEIQLKNVVYQKISSLQKEVSQLYAGDGYSVSSFDALHQDFIQKTSLIRSDEEDSLFDDRERAGETRPLSASFSRKEQMSEEGEVENLQWSRTIDSKKSFMFAYIVRDIGGLLDANSAGAESEILDGSKSNSYFASIKKSSTTLARDLAQIVQWRSGVRTTSEIQEELLGSQDQPGLCETGSLDSNDRSRVFLSRQDFLNFCKERNLQRTSLFRHFSATKPTSQINGVRLKTPRILKSKLIHAYSLYGQSSDYFVSVENGNFLRKFPLARLRWLSERDANGTPVPQYQNAIKQHFGLKWDPTNRYFVYTSPDTDLPVDHIKTVTEISTLNREPDFFEYLKMAIKNESLGQYAGYNMSYTQMDIDKSIDNHLVKIGANIIDQSDADDIPTAIFTKFKDWARSTYNGTAMTGSCYRPGNSEIINFGVENIPYPNELLSVMHRPITSVVNGYLQFELWNPHRAPLKSSSFIGYKGAKIESFRIKGYEGKALIKATVGMSNFCGSIDGNTQGWTDVQYQTAALTNSNFFTTPLSSFSNTTPLTFRPENLSKYREPSLINAISGEIFGPLPVSGENVIQVGSQAVKYPALVPGDPPTSAAWTMWANIVKPRDYSCIFFRFGDESNDPQTPISFQLECLVNQEWIPCSRYEELAPPVRPNVKDDFNFEDINEDFWLWGTYLDTNFHYGKWNNRDVGQIGSSKARASISLIDPRTTRFSWSPSGTGTPGYSIRPFSGIIKRPLDYGYMGANNVTLNSWWQMGSFIGNVAQNVTGGNYYRSPGESSPFISNYPLIPFWNQSSIDAQPLALIGKNISSATNGYLLSYADSDGIVRPADYAYCPDIDFPTLIGALNARPIILNRPFRNVGELGLVFRDIPYKSLDFFSIFSADLRLMDLFTIQENPVVSGLVDLSKIKPEIAQALMEESYNIPGFLTNGLTDFSDFSTASFLSGFQYKNSLSEVIKSYIQKSTSNGVPKNGNKIYTESPIRALSSFADVDSKTYFMDIEVGEDSSSKGNRSLFSTKVRNWVQFSIDRNTGSILAIEWEPVIN